MILADRRSAFPQVAGVSSWVSVLIAAVSTFLGFAIEAGSGHQELGTVFALFFSAGCIAAVLAVRQSAIFTAVIQPPLLLFVAVPLSYFLLHGSELSGVKGFLITCGYPLIERFPLMLFTSAAVLLIGLIRWYLATAAPRQGGTEQQSHGGQDGLGGHGGHGGHGGLFGHGGHSGLFGALVARLSAGRPQHVGNGSTRARREQRSARTSTATRSGRPSRGDGRGARGQSRRETDPRRRQRPAPEQSRQRRPAERDRREAYPPRQPGQPRRDSGYQSRPAYPRDPYPGDPHSPYPPRSRPQTHHPVSRVRYRGDGEYGQYPDRPQGR